MSMAQNVIGEISLKSPHEMEWRIQNFFELPTDQTFYSPPISCFNGTWCLGCKPGGGLDNSILIQVERVLSTAKRGNMLRIGIKNVEGLEFISRMLDKRHWLSGELYRASLYVKRDYLHRNNSVAPEGQLTFFCNLGHEPSDKEVSRTTHCKGLNNLSQNLKDLFLREEHCDVSLHVREQEFKAHKSILVARSNVFSSMFTHDTTEKKTGIVEISDCEPVVFRQFLTYLYSGQFENVPANQVFDLYAIADKYNVSALKYECVSFMKYNMAVDTFCDAVSIAVRHGETELIESATSYFVANVNKIHLTASWIAFMKEHTDESHKLYVKAINREDSE